MPKRNVLVTGGAGFIGSNFVPYYLAEHPDSRLINLDKLTYAGDLSNLREVEGHPNYVLCQRRHLRPRLLSINCSRITPSTALSILAAESHVDNSIFGPGCLYPNQCGGNLHRAAGCGQDRVEGKTVCSPIRI